MSEGTLGDIAIVTFLQAFAVAVSKFDNVPLDDRNSATFMRLFDGYLGEIVQMAEAEGQDVRKNVDFLRKGLEQALEQTQ